MDKTDASSLTTTMAKVSFAPLLSSSTSTTTVSTVSTTSDSTNMSISSGHENLSRTVVLNVGGYHYEVSRSLLQQYPNIMLSRAISDIWNPQNNNGTTSKNSNGPIFIDRDGNRFAYILDYMRDGGFIELPYNGPITKETLIAELLYYGFELDEVTVHNITIGPVPMSKVYDCIKDSHKLYKDKIADYDKQIHRLQDEKLYTYVSYKCFHAIIQNRNYTFQLSKVITRKESYDQFLNYLSGKYTKDTNHSTTTTGSIATDRAVSSKDRKKKKQEQKEFYEYHKELFNISLQEYGLQFITLDPANSDIIHLSSLE